jgi:hypothetical protein
MKTFQKAFLGVLAGLAASLALAAVTYVSGTGYTGFNPATSVVGENGVTVNTLGVAYATTSNTSGIAVPALVVTGTSCAATTPVVGGNLGAATYVTGSGTATCTYTITNLPTVTTGYVCIGLDATTPADVLVQSASSANGCTLTQATKAASDAIIIEVFGV